MLFVLSGPSYVGKKTSIAHFMKLYSFSSVIPYTTKPNNHRVGEIEGIQYHYVEESSRADIANDDFVYDEPFNFNEYKETTLYAYRKSDILNAIESYSNFIIHASVGNVEKMHSVFSQYHTNPDVNDKTWTQQIYFIFLDFNSQLTPDFFLQKQPGYKEGTVIESLSDSKAGFINSIVNAGKTKITPDNLAVGSYGFKRRFSHAQKEIQFYRDHSNIFDTKVASDKAYEICEKLEAVILPKLKVMPTSPDKIPGPLSNMDIIYMCEKRKNDPLEIYVGGRKATSDEIEALLCGCGMHISLSNHIRKITRKPVNSFIDMAEDADDMEMILDRVYPDETINKGYVLCPHEMILCSSDESIKLPHDVYAMVASKFSYTQLGLSIELSPSIIQSGHNGKIHFQIKNNTDNYICIYPHIQVAQLLFFRTIQPSTKVYYEDSNHAYDREYPSPLSKFRDANPALDKAKKPKAGFIKAILLQLKEKMTAAVVGIFCTIALCIFWASQLYDVAQNYIIPLIKNLPITAHVVLFALISCTANTLVYIIGASILHILGRISHFLHKRKREKND